MSVVVLTSAGSAPGTTSCALGLTLAWPRPAVLVDADRWPTQAVLAGYMGGADPDGRGLSTFALDVREGRGREGVDAHCLALNESGDKRLLPGFASPGAAALFEPVWPVLVGALNEGDVDVIVDAGRIGPGLPASLLATADVVMVVTRSCLRSVAAQRLYLAGLLEQADSTHAHIGLLVIGPGRPHATGEVAQVLGLPVWGEVAWDPERASVLSDGCAPDRRFASSPLIKSYARTAAELCRYLDSQQRLVAGATA